MQNKERAQVRVLHEEKGISYSFIARKTGITYAFLSMWLNGKRNFSNQTLLKLQRYLAEN